MPVAFLCHHVMYFVYKFVSVSWALYIGGLSVVAFWRSPHGPLGSGPPRAGYSQRRKRKEKGKRATLIFLPRPV